MSDIFLPRPCVANLCNSNPYSRAVAVSQTYPKSFGFSNRKICRRHQGSLTSAAGHGRHDEHWSGEEHVHTVSIDPSPPAAPSTSEQGSWPPYWPVIGAVGTLLLLGVTRAIGASRRRRELSDLEARGVLDESRDQKDPYLEDVMENMGRVQYGDLSKDQINEARNRRSRARHACHLLPDANYMSSNLINHLCHSVSGEHRPGSQVNCMSCFKFEFRPQSTGDHLGSCRAGKSPPNEEDIDIPSNHPFAKREQITQEQEELMKKRLQVKRGLPLQDLQGTRGLPGLPVPQFQPPPPQSD